MSYINPTMQLHHQASYLNHDRDSQWINILPKTIESFEIYLKFLHLKFDED